MTGYFELVKWVGFLSVVAYIPLLCYLDLRYRRVPWWVWIPMLAANMPATYYLYTNGLQWGYALFSVIMTLVFMAVCITWHGFEGADMLLLTFIAWFCPLDPFFPENNVFQIKFMVWLTLSMLVTALLIFLYNATTRQQLPLIEMFQRMPRHVPMMIPIAAAYLCSVWV